MAQSHSLAETPSRFEIQRIYVKEQSCKVPHAPAVFLEEWKPQVQLEMNLKYDDLKSSLFTVTLSLQLTAKNQQKTVFTIDMQQAGIFKVEGFEEKDKQQLLNAYCPNILYPCARKVIIDMTTNAGFPPVILAPVDFQTAYQQQLKSQQEAQETVEVQPAKEEQKALH